MSVLDERPRGRHLVLFVCVVMGVLAVLTRERKVVPTVDAQGDPAALVDQCVVDEMRTDGIHGGQIAVMRDGEMVFERAYGRRHRDSAEPVDTATEFRIGSTTKTMTALAIMQQVDAGTIELDAPITRYLQDFELAEPGQADAITVRHLLTHASGLHDTSAFDESDLFGPTDAGAMRRWVDEQKGLVPYAPPGRFWNYSSANYMYLGQILERVTGMSYQDYMDQRVYEPAALTRTTMHAAETVAEGNFAYGHFQSPFSGQLEIYDLNQANNWARHPTGYANSTAGDLVRFATVVMQGGAGLISAESAAEMQSAQQHRDLRIDQYYGIGTFVEQFQGNEMVHHDGGAWGWTATMKWIPSARVAVATTANVGGATLDSATACALRAYVEPGQTEPNPCRLDKGRWDDFAGTYEGSLNTGERWTMEVIRPMPDGNLQMRVIREAGADITTTLTQDCGVWVGSGEGSFNTSGLGQITFIEDPEEPGAWWIRNRFFSAGRRPDAAPTPVPQPSPTIAVRWSAYLPLTSAGH
jgi:CubicO group peptidase (beta-lactamase class C family)